MSGVVERVAARVVLLDAAGRVLLLHGGDPAAPESGTYWFTVGGGLDDGETLLQAAVREVREETGLVCTEADLVGPVFEETVRFSLGGDDVLQHNTFFVLRVEAHDVDTSGFDAFEQTYVSEHRWWHPDDLEGVRYYPPNLRELCRPEGAGPCGEAGLC